MAEVTRLPVSFRTATTEELFECVSGLLKEQEYAHEVVVDGREYRLCDSTSMFFLEMAFSMLRYKVEGSSNGWVFFDGD